jgi:hypothetical protein
MLSTGYGFLTDPQRFSPRARTLIVNVIVFPRGNAAVLTGHSGDLTLHTAKGRSQHEQRPFMLLRAYTLLTTLLALLPPRRSLSCAGYFTRGQFSHLTSE